MPLVQEWEIWKVLVAAWLVQASFWDYTKVSNIECSSYVQ